MGGCRCSYKNCLNSTKSTENIHFFHYPVKHKERCKIWIENANKPQFCDLEEDQLKNKVICEVHFEDKYFPNPQKKRLLQSAIPTLDGDSVASYVPSPKPVANNMRAFQRLHSTEEVQVLPANEDGTIFLLETDHISSRMTKPSSQIESYVYKNGVILPSHGNNVEQPTEQKRSFTLEFNKITAEELTFEHIKKAMAEIDRRQSQSQSQPQQLNFSNTPKTDDMDFEEQPPKEPVKTTSAKTQKILVEKAVKTVGRNYLRKIKQHSRDIATIKRMLKQKNLIQPDNTKILNILKQKLPPTLYNIVEFNLNNSCNMSTNDTELMQFLQASSPNMYKILTDKYQWKLPDLKTNSQQ